MTMGPKSWTKSWTKSRTKLWSKSRTAAITVCFILASAPAPALKVKGHRQSVQLAAKAAHKPARGTAAKARADKEVQALIAAAYAAMPANERLSIQSDLAWTGYYDGPPGGDFTDQRVIDAVKLFQQADKDKDTGILDEAERDRLAAAAEPHRQAVGWRLIENPATGARFGLPEKFVAASGGWREGSRWKSAHGQIEISDFRLSEASLAALFDEDKKTPAGRWVQSSLLQADSFVISGSQGLKNFVVRAQAAGTEVRGITILYDQATAGTMGPVALAMANSFRGFPDPNAASALREERAVEYGTAIVVDQNGDLVVPRAVASDCGTLTVEGFGHAVRIGEDNSNTLALIRLYGARALVPAALARRSQSGGEITLVGIADPVAQQGGGAVTKLTAHLDGLTLEPAPKLGFSGAAAIDAQGGFVGIVALRPPAVAGPGPLSPQAILLPAASVSAFLAAHGIKPSGRKRPMEQSVQRVICVRK